MSNNFYKFFFDNNLMNPSKSMFNPMNIQNLALLANKNLETMIECSRMMAKNSQSIIADQVEVAQKNFSDLMKKSQDAMTNTNPESSFDKTVNFFKTAFDHTVENIKELAEKSTKSNTEIFDLVSNKISENIADCTNYTAEVVNNVANNVKKKAA